MSDVDVLVVSFNRPDYTRATLDRLVEASPPSTRLWLWHNGNDETTLDLVRDFADRTPDTVFHHCPQNSPLRDPINWVIREGDAPFMSKVDDDCLVPDGWLDALLPPMRANPELGVIAGWIYMEDDFDPTRSAHKIRPLEGGASLMQNPWVQGSGVVARREWLEAGGVVSDDETWTHYVRRLAALGAVNGWLLPLVLIDHMDDPRSPNTGLRTDDDIARTMPLSAQRNGITTIEAWTAQLQRSAKIVQTYPAEDVEAQGNLIGLLRWKLRGLGRRVILRREW